MDERHDISKAFDEYVQELAESGGLTACDYESFEAGWQAARAQQAGSGEVVAWEAEGPKGKRLFHDETNAEMSSCIYGGGARPLVYGDAHPRASVPEGWRIQKGESVGRGDVDVVLRRNNGSAAFFRSDNDSKDALIVEFLTAMLASTTPQPADNWIKCSERQSDAINHALDVLSKHGDAFTSVGAMKVLEEMVNPPTEGAE